jgi:hypothetical protein
MQRPLQQWEQGTKCTQEEDKPMAHTKTVRRKGGDRLLFPSRPPHHKAESFRLLHLPRGSKLSWGSVTQKFRLCNPLCIQRVEESASWPSFGMACVAALSAIRKTPLQQDDTQNMVCPLYRLGLHSLTCTCIKFMLDN